MPFLFRAVVEVLGKPKEHIENALKTYLQSLKEDHNYKLLRADIAETEQQGKEELWATFAEVEVRTPSLQHLVSFCFEYMPSTLEVIEPIQVSFTDTQLSEFLSDLQARLHQVDMVAKHVKMENDMLKKSMGALLTNYVTVLLSKGGNMTSEQLSNLTGLSQDKLEDYLDTLIDKGKINLKEGFYYLVK